MLLLEIDVDHASILVPSENSNSTLDPNLLLRQQHIHLYIQILLARGIQVKAKRIA